MENGAALALCSGHSMLDKHSGDQHSPKEFAPIFAGVDAPLVVGGQAVNIWAELYVAAVPALKKFAPFTSKDADIYGTRAQAEALANRAGWEFKAVTDPNSIAVAVLSKPSASGPPLVVEVLKEVNGLTDQDLKKSEIIQFSESQRYRIPSPPVLLKAKLYNLASLVNMDRPQDLKHSQMLLRIVPQYLNEMLTQHRSGQVGDKNLVGALDYLKQVVQSGASYNAAQAYKLDLRTVIPTSVALAGGAIGEAAAKVVEGLPVRPEAINEPPPSSGYRFKA